MSTNDQNQPVSSPNKMVSEGTLPASGDYAPSSIQAALSGKKIDSFVRYERLYAHAEGGMGIISVARDETFRRNVAFKEIKPEYANFPIVSERFVLEGEITGRLEHPGIVPVYHLGRFPDGRPFYAMKFIEGESLHQAIQKYHHPNSPTGSTSIVTDNQILGISGGTNLPSIPTSQEEEYQPKPTTRLGKWGSESNLSLGISSEKNLLLRQLLKRFIDVCNAMGYAHSKGYIHRDLKPTNIMLGAFGETLVVDWGLAKYVGESGTSIFPEETPSEVVRGKANLPSSLSGTASTQAGTRQTKTGQTPHDDTKLGSVVGTPGYMSPEQAHGQWDRVGPASDIFSLGCLLYEILTGHAPYTGQNGEERLEKARQLQYPPLKQWNKNVPAPLEAITYKAMSKNPADRYVDAQSLAKDVENWLADEPVIAYREPWIARLLRWSRKHRSLVSGLMALIVTASIGLTIGLFFVNLQKNRAEAAEKDTRDALTRLEISQQKTQTALERAEAAEKDTRNALTKLEASQKKTQIALDKARSRFKQTLDTLNDMVFSIQTKLETRPGTQDLKKELLERAQKGLEDLLQDTEEGIRTDTTRIWSHFRLGDVSLLLGNTTKGMSEYEKGYQLAKSWFESDPKNPQALRDLAMGLSNLGDGRLQLNEIETGLKNYQEALRLRERDAQENPKDPTIQRNLAVSYNKIGNMLLQRGDTSGALENYQRGLKLTEPVAQANPADTGLQRDLSVSYEKLADVHLRLGETEQALKRYQDSLKISQSLAKTDPQNVQARRDLSISYERFGDVQLQQNDINGALKSYRESLSIRQSLVRDDPQNVQIKRDLAVAKDRVGNIEFDKGNLPRALEEYQESLKIRQTLLSLDAKNVQWQRDVEISWNNIGETHLFLGEIKLALKCYQDGFQIAQALAKNDPHDGQSQRDLSISYEKLGDAHLRLDQIDTARKEFLASMNIRKTLAKTDTKNAQTQKDLLISYFKLSQVEMQAMQFSEAEKWVRQAFQIADTFVRPEYFDLDRPILKSQLNFLESIQKVIEDPSNISKAPEPIRQELLSRAISIFQQKKQPQKMVECAELLVKHFSNPRAIYNAACGYAQAISFASETEKEKYAQRAVELLQQAIHKGWQDVEHIQKDPDLDSLRQRKDFQKVVEELMTKKKSPKK